MSGRNSPLLIQSDQDDLSVCNRNEKKSLGQNDVIKKMIQDAEEKKGFQTEEEKKKTILNHFWKLLVRKHSSGDLHSRLKTRKILGVGETDDGGVHRSKISQILGHNDQLYVRLPYGLRAWQFTLALLYAGLGLWAMVHPGHLFNVALQTDASHDFINLSVRLYGGALISLSILHWATLNSQDRDGIRVTLLSSIVFFIVQFIASCWHILASSFYATATTTTTTTTTTTSSTTDAGSIPEGDVNGSSSHSTIRILCASLVGCLVDWYFFWHLTYRRTYGKKMDDSRKND